MAKLINISFLEVVKVGNATSCSFQSCQAIMANIKFFKDVYGLNENEQCSLACLFFTNHWLGRGPVDFLTIPADVRQWAMEGRCKAIDELGLIIRNNVEVHLGLPSEVQERVEAWARETSSAKAQGSMATANLIQ